MILPGFPVLLSKPASGIVFPAVTVGRALIGGVAYGYIRPGGYTAGALGASGGTLSATLVPGFVTDAVISAGTLSVIIVGDCASLLSGVTAITDNGTPVPLTAFEYDPVNDITWAGADPEYTWTSTGNRTVQLV